MQFRLEKRRPQPRKPKPLPDHPKPLSAAPAPVFETSSRETDEGYGAVVAVLNPKLRVVAGSCGLQWIVQKRKNPLTWSSFAFCANQGRATLASSERRPRLRSRGMGRHRGASVIIFRGLSTTPARMRRKLEGQPKQNGRPHHPDLNDAMPF